MPLGPARPKETIACADPSASTPDTATVPVHVRGRRGRRLLAGAGGLIVACVLPGLALAAGTGSISGTVVSDVSSTPIAGMCVTADNGTIPVTAQTDAGGNYTLAGLDDAANYKVVFFGCAGSPNFAAEWWDNKQSEAAANLVAVSGGGPTSNIDASLAVGGRITGTITNAAGNPVKTCIQADGAATLQNASTETDEDGDYVLQGLQTDSFKLFILPCGPDSSSYEPGWYSHKPDHASANPVAVTAGQTTPGIDVVLAPASPIPPPPDTTAPGIEISSGPAGKTKQRRPRFGFSSADPTARFECRVDDRAATSCSSPYRTKKLKPGRHSFGVTAIDEAGNRSAEAVRKFKVKRRKRRP